MELRYASWQAAAALQNFGDHGAVPIIKRSRDEQPQENDRKRDSGDGAPRAHLPDGRGCPVEHLELLDRAMRWSAEPVMLLEEEPTSESWAEDLFAPCSSKCWLSYSNDDVTDSSGSEMCDDDDDDEDEEDDWTCSESEEELDGFSFEADGDVDFWGDRWFWTPCQEDEDFAVQSGSDLIDTSDVETLNYVAERLVDYVMPSMDPNTDAAVDSWIEKYGSSSSQVRFV